MDTVNVAFLIIGVNYPTIVSDGRRTMDDGLLLPLIYLCFLFAAFSASISRLTSRRFLVL